MTDPTADSDSLPTREMQRLRALGCVKCAQPLISQVALGNVALGFKDSPRCLPCLAGGLGRAESDLQQELVRYFSKRTCYHRAWDVAATLDPPQGWPTLAPLEPEEDIASEDEDTPMHTELWDAGEMGCGELVMMLRGRMNNLRPGSVLKLIAQDLGAPEDIPAWCRMTGHALVSQHHPTYFIRRKD